MSVGRFIKFCWLVCVLGLFAGCSESAPPQATSPAPVVSIPLAVAQTVVNPTTPPVAGTTSGRVKMTPEEIERRVAEAKADAVQAKDNLNVAAAEYQANTKAELEKLEANLKQNADVARSAIEQAAEATRIQIAEMEKQKNEQVGQLNADLDRKIAEFRSEYLAQLKQAVAERQAKVDAARKGQSSKASK